MAKQLLLIEDDAVLAQVLQNSLQKRGVQCTYISTIAEAEQLDSSINFDYIVLDMYLDGESGLILLPKLRECYLKARILILTGYASIATTVQAIKLGADNYLPKPANTSQIMGALTQDSIGLEVSPRPQEPMLEVNEDDSRTSEFDVLSVERLQWEHIQTVLAQHDGNISATARALGMHRRTLQRRLSKKPRSK